MRVRSIFRNPFSVTVSLFVLLIALLGSAFGDDDFEPRQQQQQRRPQLTKTPTPAVVRHNTKFAAVPGTSLQIRAVQYDGSVNGTLIVEVKNLTKTAQKFSAAGLYFVPEGNADQAPQRLGAVGPMQLTKGERKDTQELTIAANATVEIELDVFCIDSHRSAPTTQNVFNVGKTRMPKELATTINDRADLAVKTKGAPRKASKSEIQSEVWKTRDSKWIQLDGEGAQEAAK